MACVLLMVDIRDKLMCYMPNCILVEPVMPDCEVVEVIFSLSACCINSAPEFSWVSLSKLRLGFFLLGQSYGSNSLRLQILAKMLRSPSLELRVVQRGLQLIHVGASTLMLYGVRPETQPSCCLMAAWFVGAIKQAPWIVSLITRCWLLPCLAAIFSLIINLATTPRRELRLLFPLTGFIVIPPPLE